MSPESPVKRRLGFRRGTYLLPSLFTFGNILLGFFALVRGFRQEFEIAAVLIYLAALLDGLDGRIARLTHTESAFGKELDSLADVVAFGAAPAFLAYMWGLSRLGRLGWLIPVFFLLCAAIRLARFNVQTRAVDSRYFVGLPAPAAAGTVAAVLFFFPDGQEPGSALLITMSATLVVVAGLMVSTFRFRSFKEFDLKRRWSYRTAALVAVLLLLIAYNPSTVFFSAVILYTLSGPVEWAIRRRSLLRPSTAPTRTQEDQ